MCVPTYVFVQRRSSLKEKKNIVIIIQIHIRGCADSCWYERWKTGSFYRIYSSYHGNTY